MAYYKVIPVVKSAIQGKEIEGGGFRAEAKASAPFHQCKGPGMRTPLSVQESLGGSGAGSR